MVGELLIDKKLCWGFYDGACQEHGQTCGLGGELYISDSHFITFKVNSGKRTNNLVEFQALKSLLKLDQKLIG